MSETLISSRKKCDLSNISSVVTELIPLLDKYPLLTLSGDLGAGKTKLVQEIGKSLNIKANISSPSFNILNIYDYKDIEIYHYDLYRLKHPDEIINLDLDYALENSLTIIEWPEIILHLLPKNIIHIDIKIIENYREYNITYPNEK